MIHEKLGPAPRTWKGFVDHPKVEDAFRDSDGYWVVLRKPFVCGMSGCRTMHEMTIKELRIAWPYIETED